MFIDMSKQLRISLKKKTTVIGASWCIQYSDRPIYNNGEFKHSLNTYFWLSLMPSNCLHEMQAAGARLAGDQLGGVICITLSVDTRYLIRYWVGIEASKLASQGFSYTPHLVYHAAELKVWRHEDASK